MPLGPGASTPARAILTVLCAIGGMATLVIAGLRVRAPRLWRQRALRRKTSFIALGLLMATVTLLILAGGTRLTFAKSLSRSYWSDVVSFSYVNARLVLQGQNPYTSNAAFFPTLQRFPYALETPLRQGAFGHGFDYPSMKELNAIERQFLASPSARHGEFDPATLHSYPALSFLLYLPLVWAGWDNILLLNVAAFAGIFAWQVWLSPPGERHWGALVAGSVGALALFSLFLDNEVICLGVLLLAWHYRRHRWASAILLGLACAFKQYSWFFAPFFLLDALLSGVSASPLPACESGGATLGGRARQVVTYIRQANWGEMGSRGLIALGAFLVPNLPFIVASPGAWWSSLWLPQSEPLFPMGMGVIALFTGHLLPYVTPRIFTLLELVALIGSLVAAVRWRAALGDGVLLLALIPLLFAFRSLPNYFGVAPWIALYAANLAYRANLAARAVTVRRGSGGHVSQHGRQTHLGARYAR